MFGYSNVRVTIPKFVEIPFQVPFLKRYIDDIITCTPKDQIETAKTIFNSFQPRIQFTIEEDEAGAIPFLDVLLISENNTKITGTINRRFRKDF